MKTDRWRQAANGLFALTQIAGGSFAIVTGIGLPIPQESVPAQSMCSDELLRNTRPVRCLHGGDLLPTAAVLRARRWIGPCSQPDPC